MSKAVAKIPATNLPIVSGWQNTNDLLRDIQHTLNQFRTGALDCEQARLQVRAFQAVAAVLALQLEHAKITERLKRGDQKLPGFDL